MTPVSGLWIVLAKHKRLAMLLPAVSTALLISLKETIVPDQTCLWIGVPEVW